MNLYLMIDRRKNNEKGQVLVNSQNDWDYINRYPIVLIALWYGLRTLSLNSAQKVMDDIHLFNEISGPNVQISNQVYDDHLLGGK